MRRFTWVLLAFLQTAAAPQLPGAGIQGVVLRAGGEAAERLADARVALIEGPGAPLVTRTDGAGRFAFSNLAAGVYRIQAGKDGYLRQEFGANGPRMPGMPINLTATGQVEVAFRLDPAPTLAGAVTDEDGEPMPRVLVQALRAAYDPRGAPTLVPEFFARTDDNGRYRLYWIDPGAYYVSAWANGETLEEAGAAAPPSTAMARLGYPPVYHTGVSDPEGITPLEIGIGDEPDGLNFRLTRELHATISGVVYGSSDEQFLSTRVSMVSIGSVRTVFPRIARINPDATFKIEGIAPGSYLVVARSDSGHRGTVRVDFGREDLRDVRIDTVPPAQIAGQVYAEAAANADLRQARVYLTPLETGLARPPASRIQPDGAFALSGVEMGSYLIEMTGLPGDAYLRAARFGDRDPLEHPEQGLIINGHPTETLKLLIAFDGGRLAGTVRSGSQPAAGALAVLVPDAASRNRPDHYRIASADARGAFVIPGIPPGSYTLFAWDSVEPNAYKNAEFLEAHAGSGVAVRIEPGANPPAAVELARRRAAAVRDGGPINP